MASPDWYCSVCDVAYDGSECDPDGEHLCEAYLRRALDSAEAIRDRTRNIASLALTHLEHAAEVLTCDSPNFGECLAVRAKELRAELSQTMKGGTHADEPSKTAAPGDGVNQRTDQPGVIPATDATGPGADLVDGLDQRPALCTWCGRPKGSAACQRLHP